jgi:hypothetical protein
MDLTLFATLIPVGAFAVYRLTQQKTKNRITSPANKPCLSDVKYSLLIKDNGQVYSEYEENDLRKIGYHIYTKLEKPNQSYEIYIRQNLKNELMWINKDYESECKISVANPEGETIGYLPFSKVSSI